MSRKFLIPLLTAVFLATPAFTPATMTSLSGSALAQKTTPTTAATNLNSSRSNIYRTKQTGKTTKRIGTTKQPARGESARATTVKSSKSNTSD
jgi:hypothetical protein